MCDRYRRRDAIAGERTMSNGSTLSLPELENRIAILRDNIRQLVEQAAVSSGAGDESRNADRIAEQTESWQGWSRSAMRCLQKRNKPKR
jgi:uncharacterized small protein (DUF1192 family)